MCIMIRAPNDIFCDLIMQLFNRLHIFIFKLTNCIVYLQDPIGNKLSIKLVSMGYPRNIYEIRNIYMFIYNIFKYINLYFL